MNKNTTRQTRQQTTREMVRSAVADVVDGRSNKNNNKNISITSDDVLVVKKKDQEQKKKDEEEENDHHTSNNNNNHNNNNINNKNDDDENKYNNNNNKNEDVVLFWGMTSMELYKNIFDITIMLLVLYDMSSSSSLGSNRNISYESIKTNIIGRVIVSAIFYCIVHQVWYLLDIHKHYGVWKTSEPKQHMKFAMKTSSWIVCLGAMGIYVSERVLQFTNIRGGGGISVQYRFKSTQLGGLVGYIMAPEEEEQTYIQNIFMSVFIFYIMDFCRYWSHRIGHTQFFYNTFPMSHSHHHNQIFVNPAHLIVSPLGNLEIWSNAIPVCCFAYLGWNKAASYAWIICALPNWTQHLGCDVMPWLTKINHYYFYGALPWIPLYHTYHHLHIIRSGNYSNLTALWDYVFNTLQPESIYHIEHDQPLPYIQRFFDNPKLGITLEKNYIIGQKNRLDFNKFQ